MSKVHLITHETIASKIFFVRFHKVMLDRDLAGLYKVGTRDLNKAVKRNLDRFPEDFMFRLNKKEVENLMFQTGTSSWGGTRKPPYVFTEQGVAMLSSVLRSKRAVQVNIQIMRTFAQIRQMLSAHKDLKRKIEDLEKKYDSRLNKHDDQFKVVFEAIKQLIADNEKPRRKIGFLNE